MTKIDEAKNFYTVRSSSLPVSKFFYLNGLLKNSQTDEFEQLFHYFKDEIQKNPLFRAAVYASTPVLLSEFERFDSYSTSKKVRKAVLSLYKYYTRACSRPVPFGFFSGCGMGEFAFGPSMIERNPIIENEYYIDLDYEIRYEISDALLRNDIVIKKSLFFPNNTIYDTNGETVRYVKFEMLENKLRHYVCKVENNYYLNEILNLSKNGISFPSIREHFFKNGEEVEEGDLFAFFKSMIREQLIISMFAPLLTEDNYIGKLIQKADIIVHSDLDLFNLKSLESTVGLKKVNQPYDHFLLINNRLTKLLNSDKLHKNSFIINTIHSFKKNTISNRTFNRIKKNIEDLSPFLEMVKTNTLEVFKKKFEKRYGESEVPLLEALDPELGVGYGLLDEDIEDGDSVPFKNFDNKVDSGRLFSSLDLYKLSIAVTTINKNEKKIILTKEMIQKFSSKIKNRLPREYSVTGSLYSHEGEDIFHFHNMSGPNAYFKLSRFLWGDNKMRQQIENIKRETIDNYLLAEIVHAPQLRSLNITSRPLASTEFQIPIINNSNFIDEKTILLSDLVISLIGGKIRIRSLSLNKFIIPVNNTALNYNYHNISIYKFLCDVQEDFELCYLNWEWNKELFKYFKFLPRVEYNTMILSKARWNILYEGRKVPDLIRSFLLDFLDKEEVPNVVCLNNFDDDEILIDRQTDLGKDLLVQELTKRSHLILTEYLGNELISAVRENGRELINEVIIPIINEETSLLGSTPKAIKNDISSFEIQRDFFYGSGWTYIKLYCNNKVADELLLEEIGPFMNEMKAIENIEFWFFIRYRDPDPHIRVRYFNTSISNNYKHLSTEFIKRLSESKFGSQIKDIQICKYQRELERYGWENIEKIEKVFCIDSESTLFLIKLCKNHSIKREELGFCVLKNWLDLFFVNNEEKLAFCVWVRDSFLEEFKGGSELIHELNLKFDNAKYNLQKIIIHPVINKNLKEKSIQIFEYIKETMVSEYYSSNLEKREELYSSLIHMSINRLFNKDQRKHELVLYHFMTKSLTKLKFTAV